MSTLAAKAKSAADAAARTAADAAVRRVAAHTHVIQQQTQAAAEYVATEQVKTAAGAMGVTAAAAGVAGSVGVAAVNSVASTVAPAIVEMTRIPNDVPPPGWSEPTTCWCGCPVMQPGVCALGAKLACLPPAIVAYVLGILLYGLTEGGYRNNGSLQLAMCLCCPKEALKLAVWDGSATGTMYSSPGVHHILVRALVTKLRDELID